MTQGQRAITVLAALAATVALSLPSVAQQRQNGQCWKQTDGTKPYGYYAACPKPEKQANANTQAAVQPNAQAAGGRQNGQCWKQTDGTKPYGYYAACPKPEKQASANSQPAVQPNAQFAAGPQAAGSNPGQCWKATDGTKPYGYWTECN
jgi:hypothetical protein